LPQVRDAGEGARMTTVSVGRPVFDLRVLRWARAGVSRAALVDLLFIGALIALAGFSHGVNMFDFPYYHDDEGIYMAQAWAVAEQGRLAPYTYWYDHAPLGWVQIAVWSSISGGFGAFGTAIASGRVFMLVLHVASTLLVFVIGRSLSGRAWVGLLAALLFTLNGYGLFWQRRVMLDNIAALWMLASIALLMVGRPSLKRVWLSAVALAVSILSKEITVFLIPAMSYLAYHRVHPVQRWFAAVGWPAIAGSIVSLYVLFAALRNELFPTGTLLGGTSEHVSLLGTLKWQAERGQDGGAFDGASQFWSIVAGSWGPNEPLLVVGGTLGALFAVLLIRRDKRIGALGLLTLSLWAFLARGGVVYDQYLVPLVPLLALTVAIAMGRLVDAVERGGNASRPGLPGRARGSIHLAVRTALVLVTVPLLLTGYGNLNFGTGGAPMGHWQSHQGVGQRDALEWVDGHLPASSSIVMDATWYVDLHDDVGESFALAHHYFKVDLDPEVREGVFEGRWQNVDYVIADSTLAHQAAWDNLEIVLGALEHSTPVASFDTGWPIEIRRVDLTHRVDATEHPMLASAWQDYLLGSAMEQRPATASTPAQGLVPAVYMDDRPTFDATLASFWASDRQGSGTAARDSDVALGLLLGVARWDDPALRAQAIKLVDRIWASTARVDGMRLPMTRTADGTLHVDVDALTPHAYRLFAEVDPDHAWNSVADSVYRLLARMEPDGGEWPAGVDIAGEDVQATPGAGGTQRLNVSLLLDWLWHGTPAARTILAAGSPSAESIPVDATLSEVVRRYLPGLLASGAEPEAARLFASRVLAGEIPAEARIDQALTRWLGIAVMDGSLANLWAGERVIAWDRSQRSIPGVHTAGEDVP
jgi:hypothetical protein